MGIDIIAVLKKIRDFFVKTWSDISNWIGSMIGKITRILSTWLLDLSLWWNTQWTLIKDSFREVWRVISEIITNNMIEIQAFLSNIIEPITNTFNLLWGAVSTVTSGAMESLKSIVKGALNWIIGKINLFIAKLNSVAQAGSKITGLSIPTIPTIPQLAKGGIVSSPTLAMIGEAGPEAVVPLNRKNGRIGGTTVNISIGSFFGGDPERAAREIGDLIIKRLQLNASVS